MMAGKKKARSSGATLERVVDTGQTAKLSLQFQADFTTDRRRRQFAVQ